MGRSVTANNSRKQVFSGIVVVNTGEQGIQAIGLVFVTIGNTVLCWQLVVE